MPMSVEEEFFRYLSPTDDPEIEERGRNLTRLMVKKYPEVRREVIEEVLEEKVKQVFRHQFERRLGRALTTEEQQVLNDRFARTGPDRLGDVVLDLSPEALAAWLADPTAT
jgi:hypothetical protein